MYRIYRWLSALSRRTRIGLIIGVLLLPYAVLAFHSLTLIRLDPRYQLANESMLGKTSKILAKKVSYDAKQQAYIFNKDAAASVSAGSAALLSQQTASDTSTAENKSYTASVTKGDGGALTIRNPELDVAFSIVPKFDTYEGRQYANRLAYPLKGTAASVVYSFKNNGVKEDVVLTKNIGDTLSLQYALKLPKSLEARTVADGSIGVYSADPMLYSNITFGGDKDQALVEKAKENGAKTNLVFAIPAPTITQAHPGGKAAPTASFDLAKTSDGSQQFTMHATGLNRANYPLSIDPSVVVSSVSNFRLGNNENNITYANGNAARDALTGWGTLNSWATTTPMPIGRYGQTSVAYNGFLYVLGGNGTLATTQYAPINANGTLGAWTAGTSFATGRTYHASVAYNGYMYVMGGNLTDVQYAPISPSGALGAWTVTTSLPTARYFFSAIAYNGYVYVIGGTGVALQTTLQYAPINANGTLGAWTPTNTFATPRHSLTSVVYNGYMYITGGTNGGALADVQYAPINANGTLGAWTPTTSFTTARYNHTSGIINGFLYIMGGTVDGTTPLADTQYAPINANGTIGSWTATTSIAARRIHSGAVYNGYLYVIGGFNGAGLASVQYTSLAPTGSAGTWTPAIGSWSASTSYTAGRSGLSSAAYNGYMYIMGGTTAGGAVNDVQYAPINANGTLGAWTPTTSFVNPRSNQATVAYNGYMYLLGGSNLSDVQYAVINPNGSLGTWTPTTSFNGLGRQYVNAVAYNGYMYLMGSGSDTQYAPINADGTLGTWTASTSFATPRDSFALVAYNNYLYIMGGNGALADTQYAPINANGTLGTWNASANLTSGRTGPTAVAANGYMYLMGGNNGTTVATTQYAPINPDGSFGTWVASTAMTTARQYAAAATYNGYVYVLGGNNGTNQLASTEYAALGTATFASKARYSRLFDLGVSTTLSNLTLTYAGAGSVDISYRTAESATFSVSRSIAGYISGRTVPLSGTARYVWVEATIFDDPNRTANAVIGTAITNITLDYVAFHTPVDSYMRHGNFFNGGIEQPFDTLPE